jgi:hypothetical protein
MVTRSRGAMGSGEAHPHLADLVSSGGVLAPDRAQFLTWTVVGCVGYVVMVLQVAPEGLKALPEVPPSLLTVMGLSASVYIGGKAVRLPGPVLNDVKTTLTPAAAPAGARLTISVKGQNIHKDAVITLDGSPLQVERKPGPAGAGAVDAALVSGMDLLDVGSQWVTGDHLLRFTNLDGQFAEAWFTHEPPAITNVTDAAGAPDQLTPARAAAQVTVSGTLLRMGSSADWLAPGASAPVVISAADVQVAEDGSTATVPIPVGMQKGNGIVGLVSPRGIRASRAVKV